MSSRVILLFSADPAIEALVRKAVPASGGSVHVIQSSPEAFRRLRDGCADVDLAIIDLDPGVHGAALLEAAGDRLPVIVLTSLEENYMQPIAARHGATACLAKPLTAGRLEQEVARVLRAPPATS